MAHLDISSFHNNTLKVRETEKYIVKIQIYSKQDACSGVRPRGWQNTIAIFQKNNLIHVDVLHFLTAVTS
jgi:hypothetical protein